MSRFNEHMRTARSLLFDLARRDYQQQYQGAYLGFLWVYIQPLLFIGVLYLIFTLGLRAQQTMAVPFALYLICGMVCWTFLSGNMSSIGSVVSSHAFLVKKVEFDLSILPFVKILSSMTSHVFLLCVAIGLAWYQGFHPSWYTLQVFYYFLCMCVLLTGVGWITSSTSVFVRDVSNVVAIVTQFGFWLTPIFWNLSMLPAQYQWIIKLNPAYYLVSGYRDAILLGIPFWHRPE